MDQAGKGVVGTLADQSAAFEQGAQSDVRRFAAACPLHEAPRGAGGYERPHTGMWSNITDEVIANADDGSLALPPILPPGESEGSPHNASGEYPGDNSGNSIGKSMRL